MIVMIFLFIKDIIHHSSSFSRSIFQDAIALTIKSEQLTISQVIRRKISKPRI
jgi:hypothetical protein